MNNEKFISAIREAFTIFLDSGSRSNKKLIVLHGIISSDLKTTLGDNYEIHSLGYGKGKEGKVQGRYYDKQVDILVTLNKKPVAAYGVKYVMQNYMQNSNNYFENMLGETANIRSGNIPYFQILVMHSTMPYFKKDKTISKWEVLSEHNIKKYLTMSHDNIDYYFHTPVKTLVFLVDIPIDKKIKTDKTTYVQYYSNQENLSLSVSSDYEYYHGSNLIINDYKEFIEKTTHYIKSI